MHPTAEYAFQWGVVGDYIGILIAALGITFAIALASFVLAVVVGLIAALARLQRFRVISFLAAAFIDFFRAVPLLVLLIWLYYGLSLVLNIDLNAFQAGVLGLGLLYAAFLAEIFRSGIQAIPNGQREAASTLGMSRWQTSRYVVLPQAIRIVIPAIANNFIGVLKDATLVSILGLNEIMRTAQTIVVTTFRPFEVYTFVALVYVVIVLIFSRLVRVLERRVSVS